MKSNNNKYIRPEQKGQIIFVIFILLAIAVGLIWNVVEEDKKAVVPDSSFPMANANISWQQTFYGGEMKW